MSAGSNETAADVWGRFVRTPSLGAHPAWIAGMFDGALPLEAAGRLAAHPRFASRVSSLMAARHGFGDIDAPAEPADQAIALSDSQTLGTIIRRAGAVCWADPIAREIRAPEVAALKSALGEDAYQAALAHRMEAFSPAALGVTQDEMRALGHAALAAAAIGAGRACLAAWLEQQPRGVADRVSLRFDPQDALPEPQDAHRAYGPGVVRLVAG